MTTLYRKYRPQTFSEIIGQGHIVQTLSNAIAHGRAAHAYLFTGPRGTGKTTMARIFARSINCTGRKETDLPPTASAKADPCLKCQNCLSIADGKSFDVFEIDAASNTGVDNIRELRETVKLPPTLGKYKIYIIDEVHMLSSGAFNALLKTLEEPPSHVIFILATTEIHKVPQTIVSRCQRFDFTRLSMEHIIEKLSLVAKSEGIEIEKSALEMIAIAAEGGMRDAESLLAQVISLEDKKISAKEVEEVLGTSKWESLFQMGELLLKKDTRKAIELVNDLSRDGYDLDIFHKSLLNFLRQMLLVSVDKDLAKTFSYELTGEQTEKTLALAASADSARMLRILECFTEIQGKVKSSFIPQLPLELAIVKATGEPGSTADSETSFVPAAPAPKPAYVQPPVTRNEPPAPSATVTPVPQTSPQPAKIEAVPQKEALAVQTEPAPQENPTGDMSPAAGLTINDVERKWTMFCEDVKIYNQSLATIFPSCRPYKIEGSVIILAAKFPFHRDKLNEDANRLTMEASFARILGSSVRIKAVTMQEAGLSAPSSALSHHPSEKAPEQPKETSSLLADAMGILGGQIVE